ncbi:MAG: class I SAM-dependent DNA methyltransferase [Thermoanaerobaculia bacterium]
MDIETFTAKWSASGAAERANKDAFLLDLCDLLGVPRPDPATGDPERDRYTFERDAVIVDEGEKQSIGKMDLYKEACFVLEAKQGSDEGSKKVGSARRHTGSWIIAMQSAEGQARNYARTLPAPPPFLVVCDIGHCFDLFAVFDGSTAYRPFPDPQHNRIFLADLGKHVDLFRALFTDPLSLDPARRSAAVTREVAAHLATLAKELHAAKHGPEQVARFLMRCLFTMFAEDVGLLPERLFSEHLEKEWIPHPERFAADVESLWQGMNRGGYIFGIGQLLRFNGGLFSAPSGLPLTKAHLTLLLEAAKCNWSDVEPAIFGTLLERALDPVERHQLGAHFTPRAYVERLVKPTIEDPMRDDWNAVRAEALTILKEGKDEKSVEKAIGVVRDFHHRLCHTRVLDPACGSGNFLYVTLDLFKRLEAEVLALLKELGDTTDFLNVEGLSVTPQQFLGIEVKPWAKEIAELVLWIGYLQWHYRTHGKTPPREPVLHDYKNIVCRDAVLAYDREELVTDPTTEKPITRWDGRTYKKSPVTGEDVPDEAARVPLYRYLNPRKAEWPEAEFVVGNPPFIGNKRMRQALGDGYVEALREAHADVPESADYVMYWWNHSANLLRAGKLRRFGLITTNSITQSFNRTLVQKTLSATGDVSIVTAIPDHPWVDSSDGAAVRIAMTVCGAGSQAGQLLKVARETEGPYGEAAVEFEAHSGTINADLSCGANVAAAATLRANEGLSFMGVILVGQGFVVEAEDPLIGQEPAALKPYLVGNELNQRRKDRRVIDFFGLSVEEARERFPISFQRVLERVKPERAASRDHTFRTVWWIHGRPRPEMRAAIRGLLQFVAICRTAKHFVFQFVPGDILAESKIIAIALEDSFSLGVLSSRTHLVWALASGSVLEDRPTYNNTLCFDTFPFPASSDEQKTRIRAFGKSLHAHRRRQQALHPDLTITGMYNVLAKLRSGEALSAKEKVVHEQGLVSVLMQIHDDLDAAVFDAYGWPHDLTDEQILGRLVALNRERAEEEKNGLVRWLRPEFQVPKGAVPATQVVLAGTEGAEQGEAAPAAAEVAWSKKLPAQIAAVRDLFRGTSRALRFDDVTRAFKGVKKRDAEAVLDSLTALGLLTVFDSEGSRRWRAELPATPSPPPATTASKAK